MDNKVIASGLSNYYGEVEAYEESGKYYLCLGNHDGSREVEVSEEFFKAFEKEFSKHIIKGTPSMRVFFIA